MSADDSALIDDQRIERILASQSTLIDHASCEAFEAHLGADESRAELRDCLRLLEDVLPRDREAASGSVTVEGRIGRFEILGELGQGGFGVVLRALDPALKRQVALKVPRPEFLVNSEVRKRFLREGWAASRLEHPNIVPVLEAGEAGPVGYIASAICEGPSLALWLMERASPIPIVSAARLVAMLARAIEHAHGRGVLHRDLKPANVLLQRQDECGEIEASSKKTVSEDLPFIPRLCDFGLAKLLDQPVDDTKTSTVLGSPPYMAPEQAEGRNNAIGPAADIYGLGAILYELVTGRPPFRGETNLDTLRQVIQDDPARPRALRSNVPKDLETITLKCLEKQPEYRYQSALALADDLDRFLRGESVAARPTGLLRRSVKWARRRPSHAALAAFLILAGCGSAGALALGQWWRANQLARLHETNGRLAEAVGRADRSEIDARRRSFGSLVRQAQTAVQGGYNSLASRLLESAAELVPRGESAGFAWNFLNCEVKRGMTVLEEKGRLIQGMAISPDSKTLAAVVDNTSLILWDLSTGRVRSTFNDEFSILRDLAFTPDSQVLAVSHYTSPRKTSLWDVSPELTSNAPRTIVPFCPAALMFATNGHTLFGIMDNWDTSVFQKYFSVIDDRRAHIVWLSEEEGFARMGFERDAKSLKLIADVLDDKPVDPPQTTVMDLRGVAVTEDKNLIIVARGGPSVEILDRSSRPLARCIPFGQLSGMVVYSENRPMKQIPLPNWEVRIDRIRRLAPSNRREIAPQTLLGGHSVPALFAPSGEKLVIGRGDPSAEIHDLKSRSTTRHGLRGLLNALAFSADSQLLAMGEENGRILVRHLNPSNDSISINAHKKEVWGLAWSPDGKSLATSSDDHTVKIWDIAEDTTLHERTTLKGHKALVTSVAWSPDGKWLASSGYNPHEIRLWDVATKACLGILTGHEGIVRLVKFSPDGQRLATCSDDGTMRIWDLDSSGGCSSHSTLRGHDSTVSEVAWSPDGLTFVSVARDGQAILWDSLTKKPVRVWHLGTQLPTVSWSPDGQKIAAADDRGTIWVWNSASTSIDGALTFLGSDQKITTLGFSPDGRSLASAGLDRTVHVWDVLTGQEFIELVGHQAQINRLAWSPDGKTLASCDHVGIVKLWGSGPR